jgi:hypothetical protein
MGGTGGVRFRETPPKERRELVSLMNLLFIFELHYTLRNKKILPTPNFRAADLSPSCIV